MDVRRVTDEREWDGMVTQQSHAQFLQSWAWGDFQEAVGRTVYRYVADQDGAWQAAAQVMVHTIRGRWSYWYIPRGPEFHDGIDDDTMMRAGRALIDQIESDAEAGGALFLTIEPAILHDKGKLVRMMRVGRRCETVSFIQPQDTELLDLTQTEKELLQAMHHKTRYNIRLAQRKGVQVRQTHAAADIEHFIRLTSDTAARDAITTHHAEYYRTMISTLGDGPLSLFVADYQGSVIAANIVMQVGDTMTYLHGASSNQHRNVMAPHLLQWEHIKHAKAHGLRWYDFWGVGSERAGTKKRWAGITRFKRGFGGTPVSYVGACNLILRPGWYTLYKIMRRIKA